MEPSAFLEMTTRLQPLIQLAASNAVAVLAEAEEQIAALPEGQRASVEAKIAAIRASIAAMPSVE
jgi:hypothetical protein